ncbi:MAG: 3-hydroxyacyl-CoA dehydrogenase family protein [Deltaproteobacteria bacterium]|nr:3-hydroxyacyl-CoA dehydrogenase family protein [Deltaproteobacteria bacterium]
MAANQTKGEIQRAAVIGTGTMGPGIAQVLAQHGIWVRVYDIEPAQLKKARETLDRNLELMREAGFIPGDAGERVLSLIEETSELKAAVEGVDLVIEAVPEVLDLKTKVFADLDALCAEATILASNTSGLSITALARATKRPGKVVGMHWWNPPIIIPVIEVIRGETTDQAAVDAVEHLVRRIHKVPVLVKKDVPGFLGNRLQYALMREAIALLDQGVASAEDIDTMIKAGIGFKYPVMGPLETIDMAGLDIYHRVSQYLYKSLDSSKEPPPVVESKVRNNELGLKTGKGFYDYSGVDAGGLMGERIKKLLLLLKDLGYG